ncbi:eCIS core domain-containing protein [Actinacidiphila sp. ITFR-21]|uniref:eCIS core domain-containing protein n=1 Tax=Actinacidiphila sp. ITFR-21 TaxID=3075199 RepID=UPI00288AF895|nr:DUF4157 domain-containing protein [Streptomyces sp. ITFR-21]WNI15663.1 DUF4157 domain-containing protein [Streptomyces sp. ITFR-21]
MGSSALPADVRRELESLFGAELGRVRVHRGAAGAAVAWTLGADMHFAPGAFRPEDPYGRKVLGHEVAHVLQQRTGRTGRGAGRWALEAEADAAGERFAHGRPVRIAAGSGAARPTVQYYTVVAPPGRAGAGVTVGAGIWSNPTASQDAFVGQNNANAAAPLGAANPGVSFLTPANNLNLVSADPTGVTLRVSAGGRMAVEDCDLALRQPKVFYAHPDVIAESNAWRQAVGSEVLLAADTGPGAQTVTVGGQVLFRVTLRAFGGRWFDAVGPQNCDNVIAAALGVGELTPRLAADLGELPSAAPEYEVARFLVAPAPAAVGGQPQSVAQAATMRVIAAAYGAALRAGTLRAVKGASAAQHFGVNQYASPEVGEGFTICSLLHVPVGVSAMNSEVSTDVSRAGDPVLERSRIWNAHYAGVVARDGADVITLENYARTHEVADGALRPRIGYYFQMYDTAPAAPPAHTFHGAWAAAPVRAVVVADAAVAPGATHRPVRNGTKTFTNPLTLPVAIAGRGYYAFLSGRFKDQTDAQLQSAHPAAAATDAPLAQLQAVLRGLAYAMRRADTGKPTRRDLVDPWLASLRAANDPTGPTAPRNRIAVAYTLSRFEALPLT